MKIGISSCLLGNKCTFNGKDFLSDMLKALESNEALELFHFCPEESVFGTPRLNAKIVGGDGFDVLAGKAKVLDEQGHDVTDKYLKAANNFLNILYDNNVKAVFLTEGSPSCGVNVILNDEDWPKGGFKKGVGVTAALLKSKGIRIFGSFDEKLINDFLNEKKIQFNSNNNLKNLIDNPKFTELLS